MDDRLKLTQERKEQLLRRVKECLDDDTLDKTDWLQIYGILVEAHKRRASEVYEDYLKEKIAGNVHDDIHLGGTVQ